MTLLVDLLIPEEEALDLRTAQQRFDIGLLAPSGLLESPIGWSSSRTRDLFGSDISAPAPAPRPR